VATALLKPGVGLAALLTINKSDGLHVRGAFGGIGPIPPGTLPIL